LFSEGRWVWKGTEEEVNTTVCPACRRITERNPAGFVDIHGDFFHGRGQEIENLIYNTEKAETLDRPMERLIQVVRDEDGTRVTTTGVHIARRIGDAVARAYSSESTIEYLDGEKRVRISVERQE
jgi:NMD protein affecting ribosome stability and mRNA decay